MHFYRERLYSPLSWWLVGMTCALMFGAIVWTGFDLWLTLAVFTALIGITAAFLVNWGRATIEVTDGELRAGEAVLRLVNVGEVRALDEAQARALRGQRADPRAYTLIRPYLRRAVYVEVCGRESASPYWLLATRKPAELAAAIEGARPVISTDGVAVT
jgi:Protein of unknown function (DUF3093)